MSVPIVTDDDLPALATAFPGLDFTDAECRAVLLANGKVDVQAAPGSGKTTLLAAKLYLLSRRWTSEREGICVISHTNTAANEIRHRLSATPEGVRLLSHPHFIGTIHGFINQFLALPRLRSDGGTVDVIDDEVFARKARSRARANWTVKAWADQKFNGNALIEKMHFSGPKCEVVSGIGFPSMQSKSGKVLRHIKRALAEEGVFRHMDMFAFAERAMSVMPRLPRLLARRFPVVMIDEMQDTSPSQTALLSAAFGDGSIVQRFGDINQRIFSDDDGDDDEAGATFPEAPTLPMSTSRRFGSDIADIVSKVQGTESPLVGKGPALAAPPTLLVYNGDTIGIVIERFGALVLDAFDDDTVAAGGHVRAICARRSGDSKEVPGRHVGDFCPPLVIDPTNPVPKASNAWRLLAEDAGMGLAPVELGSRVERTRRIVLLALREAEATIARDLREPWRLFRVLRDQEFDLRPLRRAMRDMVMDKNAGASKATRLGHVERLYSTLSPLMPNVTVNAFAALPVFADPGGDDGQSAPKALVRTCPVTVNDRTVNVTVDTVGMTKGETHLATLYLESVGHPSGRFDVAEALAKMTGRKTKPPKSLAAQMRYVYVGLSRPTRFLCLAIHGDRLNGDDLEALVNAGWCIQTVIDSDAPRRF